MRVRVLQALQCRSLAVVNPLQNQNMHSARHAPFKEPFAEPMRAGALQKGQKHTFA
jgi:hypothetical protein